MCRENDNSPRRGGRSRGYGKHTLRETIRLLKGRRGRRRERVYQPARNYTSRKLAGSTAPRSRGDCTQMYRPSRRFISLLRPSLILASVSLCVRRGTHMHANMNFPYFGRSRRCCNALSRDGNTQSPKRENTRETRQHRPQTPKPRRGLYAERADRSGFATLSRE